MNNQIYFPSTSAAIGAQTFSQTVATTVEITTHHPRYRGTQVRTLEESNLVNGTPENPLNVLWRSVNTIGLAPIYGEFQSTDSWPNLLSLTRDVAANPAAPDVTFYELKGTTVHLDGVMEARYHTKVNQGMSCVLKMQTTYGTLA